MHEHTPSIQNLIQISQRQEEERQQNERHSESQGGNEEGKYNSYDNGNNNNRDDNYNGSNEGIVLWCRVYNNDKKGFGPYACLGRVGHHSHDFNAHPVQFVWDLLDYDKLMAVKEEEEGDDDSNGICGLGLNAFRRILDQAVVINY